MANKGLKQHRMLKQVERLSPSQKRAAKDKLAYRIIVCGTRTFTDYELFSKKMNKLVSKLKNIYLLIGDAKGVDRMASRWAFEHMWSYSIWRAKWDKYGNAAGPLRNQKMAEKGNAKACIAFWNGKSPGTKDMIKRAKKAGLTVKVVRI